MRDHVERLFLRWVRPAAPAASMAVYGVLELVRPETPSERILVPLGLSVLAGLVYAVLHPRLGSAAVFRILVVVDTLLIAWMTVALREPDVLAIAYFWSIALASFFLGARETLAATALAGLCAALVPYSGDYGAQTVVIVTDVLVLVLIGGLLALLSHQARTADAALLASSRLDASVLRITGSVRSTLELEGVLTAAAEELGRATGAARGLCRLAGQAGKLHQWTRPGVAPVEHEGGVPASVARVLATCEPLVVGQRAPELGADLVAYMEKFGTEALVAVPIVAHDEVVAVLGLHDDRPRDWAHELPLVLRVAPQVGAALAQAEAYEHERRLADLRERLIANVSHELRTPLTSTLGFLRTLERTDVDFDEERRRELLAIARGEAERLALLVEDLLELARVRHLDGRCEPDVRLADVVRRAATGLDLEGRELVVSVPDDLAVTAEPARLVQVLTNLLTNAIEHGSGRIEASGRHENGVAVVTVRDEGATLPHDHVEELFLPFARWNEDARGTGLGLAISRGIAEAHGGTLTYEGDAFTLRLPLD